MTESDKAPSVVAFTLRGGGTIVRTASVTRAVVDERFPQRRLVAQSVRETEWAAAQARCDEKWK